MAIEPTSKWLKLKHLGFRYHADMVILGFFAADVARNILPFREYAKPYFELKDNQLVFRNVSAPSPRDLLATNSQRPKLPILFVVSFTLVVSNSL